MKGPLEGVRVLVTRPERQAAAMVDALRAVGAEPVLFPAIRIEAPRDGGARLREAARAIDTFDWVVLGSANAAERTLAALDEVGSPAAGTHARWACVGPGTAGALREAGIEPALIAGRHVAEGLLEAFEGEELAGRRVLLPQAEVARPVLAHGLEAAGGEVHVVHAYRTVQDAGGAREVRERLLRGEIGAVTFTASSAVAAFEAAVGADVGGAVVAVIGPVTAATAEALGLAPVVVAETHTVQGLVEALLAHYGKRPPV
ncbi:MAG TPA: uroporphyrinogen-III synthase [Longimicrobiales bacterium]